MYKLPEELIICILAYEGNSIRWRNGKFINKYQGDVSHMNTIKLPIQCKRTRRRIKLPLGYEKSIICYYNTNNNITNIIYLTIKINFIKKTSDMSLICYNYNDDRTLDYRYRETYSYDYIMFLYDDFVDNYSIV
jgi:hypothetical protein